MMKKLLRCWSSKHDMKDFNIICLLGIETLVDNRQIIFKT